MLKGILCVCVSVEEKKKIMREGMFMFICICLQITPEAR